ncbi:MAG: PIG-L deacetylase family protein [Candidatus Nitrosotenuis sp.]
MRILVIAAHPDDEVLGMGGTIKKFVQEGHQLKIAIMATGIFARRSTNYKNSTKYELTEDTKRSMEKELINLRNDAKKAAKILGVADIEFLDFPDNEMDTISNLQVTKKIESLIATFNAEVVYTHSQHDVNVDHMALYKATITATRPTPKCKVKKVICFEVPSSTEWYFPSSFSPNIFVDISKELPAKIKALMAYKNEVRQFPHPRSAKSIEVIAKRWGTVCGFKAAEAFHLVRKLQS